MDNLGHQKLGLCAGLSLCLCLFAGGCERQAREPQSSAAAVPRIVVDTARIDFGVLLAGAKPARTVSLRNDGDGMLEILGTETSCGCTLVELDEQRIPPRESRDLQVVFDTARRKTEDYEGYIEIRSNDPATPAVRIPVAARVNPRIRATPAHLAFDGMWQGEVRHQSFAIESMLQEEVTLEAVLPLQETGITVTLDRTRVPPSDKPVKITATVTAARTGNYASEIALTSKSADSQSGGQARVSLGVRVDAPIVARPQQLYFVGREGGSVVKRLKIQATGPDGGPIRVRQIRVDRHYLEVTTDSESTREVTLQVALKAQTPEGRLPNLIEILIDAESDQGETQLRVPVRILPVFRATGDPPASSSASPS